MKKVVGLFSIFVISIFMTLGCTSTSTFSSGAKERVGNIVISSDEFAGTKSIEYKTRGYDVVFSKGVNIELNFQPYFVTNLEKNITAINLEISFKSYAKAEDSRFEKMILLSEIGKITIQLNPQNQSPEFSYRNQIFGDEFKTRCNIGLSKDEYIKLTDFITKSKSIRLAAYTTSNKAVEMSEWSSMAHKIFNEVYAYYETNLADTVFVPTEISVIQ